MKLKKFSTQVDEKLLRDLKSYAKETQRSISVIVSEAIKEYISKYPFHPASHSIVDEVLEENIELLRRLAK